MNKRIKELADQAGLNLIHDNFMTASQEKFAELIVKECLYKIVDVRIENDFEPVTDAVLIKALTDIRKHFGVEE
jgi:hypothetical protein